MIVLPDEEEPTVGAQVNALIGTALRESAPEVAPSPGFTARLAAALDALDGGGPAVEAAAPTEDGPAQLVAASS